MEGEAGEQSEHEVLGHRPRRLDGGGKLLRVSRHHYALRPLQLCPPHDRTQTHTLSRTVATPPPSNGPTKGRVPERDGDHSPPGPYQMVLSPDSPLKGTSVYGNFIQTPWLQPCSRPQSCYSRFSALWVRYHMNFENANPQRRREVDGQGTSARGTCTQRPGCSPEASEGIAVQAI